MTSQTSRAGIDIARIPVAAGLAGAIFAIGTLAILVVGIPELQLLLPAALAGGAAIALALRLAHRESH